MKNLTRILFLINISLLFSYSIINSDIQELSSDSPPLLSRVEMNHGFSLSSYSLNGFSQSYSVYNNSIFFNISDKTKFYSNLNLMYSLSNIEYNDKMNYSIDMGIKYDLNENTKFIFQISTSKYPRLYNNNLNNY